MKHCLECNIEKDLEMFSKQKLGKMGRRGRCKACISTLSKQQTKDNPEIGKAKRERANKKYPGRVTEHTRKWRAANPERAKQHNVENHKRNAGKYVAQKRYYASAARDHVKKATPIWADKLEMKKIYKQAKQLEDATGIKFHVDHTVPLRGKLVSGLNIPANLQILTAYDNLVKGNKYEV